MDQGLELVAASALDYGFRPHRHDCYVIGITTSGVQKFEYRGALRYARPGQAFVIHPDETHDGCPATNAGYGYLAAYISPELISKPIERPTPPFIPEVVSENSSLLRVLTELFDCLSGNAVDKTVVGCITSLADALLQMSDDNGEEWSDAERELIQLIYQDVVANPCLNMSMTELENRYGMSRFKITRLFRRQYGTNPQRVQLHERVALARRLIESGSKIADAAYEAGFADQSHLNRHFLKAVGTTPGKWKSLTFCPD